MDFYSARLLYVILVDDGRPRKKNHYDDSNQVQKVAFSMAEEFDDKFADVPRR